MSADMLEHFLRSSTVPGVENLHRAHPEHTMEDCEDRGLGLTESLWRQRAFLSQGHTLLSASPVPVSMLPYSDRGSENPIQKAPVKPNYQECLALKNQKAGSLQP